MSFQQPDILRNEPSRTPEIARLKAENAKLRAENVRAERDAYLRAERVKMLAQKAESGIQQ